MVGGLQLVFRLNIFDGCAAIRVAEIGLFGDARSGGNRCCLAHVHTRSSKFECHICGFHLIAVGRGVEITELLVLDRESDLYAL